MKRNPYIFLTLITIACASVILLGINVSADELIKVVGPRKPLRLGSCGDSITVGMDAELPGENHNASWVNGYYGFWQRLLGLTDVESHNQRINEVFDRFRDRIRRRNFMFAEQGADSRDFADQAQQAVDNQVDYVTVFLGHNDVCQNDPDYNYKNKIGEFLSNIEAGLNILKGGDGFGPGLPKGAVIYIVGIVNIQQLREAAKDKKALGIIDCEVLWALSLLDLYPCASILSPSGPNEFAVDLNDAINAELPILVAKYNDSTNQDYYDPNHYYYYTNAIDILSSPDEDEEPFPEYYVSDIDCFHPSAEGQRVIAAETWDINLFLPPSP